MKYFSDPQWANQKFIDVVHGYCAFTGADFDSEIKKVPAFKYEMYEEHLMAIITLLKYCMCKTKLLQTHGLFESHCVVTGVIQNIQLYVELYDNLSERADWQRELEEETRGTNGIYLRVNDFFDFCTKLHDAFIK